MILGILHPHARRLTWVLRHGAAEVGLPMDEAGWVAVDAVLVLLNLDADALAGILAQDVKSRFERRGDRMRAAQGHSTGLGCVTRAGLEASWTRYAGEGPLWHGTSLASARGIAKEGIQPMARTHVHLATALNSTVGKRAGVQVLLGASPALLAEAGLPVFLSANGVALVRQVPAACIVAIRADNATELAALFPRPLTLR